MKDRLDKNDLNRLANERGSRCISMYIPTHREGHESKQNRIVFKNAVAEARQRCADLGDSEIDIEKQFSWSYEVHQDSEFWNHQEDGLAVFVNGTQRWTFRLPVSFAEEVVVGERFHLKQLPALQVVGKPFYLLMLNQAGIELVQASRYALEKVDLEGIPDGIHDVLKYDDVERQSRFHTGMQKPATGGRQEALHHGQGEGKDDTDRTLKRYMDAFETIVRNKIGSENLPLVLAGPERLIGAYRQANHYHLLADDAVVTNFHGWHSDDVLKEAFPIAEKIWHQSRDNAVENYRRFINGSNGAHAVKGIREVLEAVEDGRVAQLFVASDVSQWGKYRSDTRDVELHGSWQGGDEDLLDRAAVDAYGNGGEVFVLRRDEMPDQELAAAVLRY